MKFHSMRELYKTFYGLQRASFKGNFCYGNYSELTGLIGKAFCYRREVDTIALLFHADCAANSVMINRRQANLPQSPKLQAALAKFHKGAA
ncbi:hypothetical protein L4D09_19625 [Photobacterium makurazakiensis]|uniref:hypothetical protein n=1 Tax=Photobacterium makurazakiensis TaxID=2910234 RepID=UPI003D1158D3